MMPRLARVERLELRQRAIEIELVDGIDRMTVGDGQGLVELRGCLDAAALLTRPQTGVIDQDAAHQLRRDGKEWPRLFQSTSR